MLLFKVGTIGMTLSRSIAAELKTQYEQRSSADAKRPSLALPDDGAGDIKVRNAPARKHLSRTQVNG